MKKAILNDGPRHGLIIDDIEGDVLVIPDATRATIAKDLQGNDRFCYGERRYIHSGQFVGDMRRFDCQP